MKLIMFDCEYCVMYMIEIYYDIFEIKWNMVENIFFLEEWFWFLLVFLLFDCVEVGSLGIGYVYCFYFIYKCWIWGNSY